MELGIGGLGYATEIGAGASAIVYRARQLDLDREVAVKVLSVGDEAFVRRFAREAKTLGKLSQNPGIVTVYDTGMTGSGQPYLILELCRSSVLDRLNGPDGAFEPLDACRAGAQVADAVSDAHNNGVIHRDIKPGNVLVSQTGRYMVTDFGISTVTGATMGQTNSVGFTAGYVAPETLSGETAGTPADIYAIGATLFHMIAGKAPFVDVEQHSNLLALAQRVIHDPVPDLRTQGVPDEVCRIIEGAMSKRPLDRPTAAQLRDQLQAVVHDLTDQGSASDGETPGANGTANPSQDPTSPDSVLGAAVAGVPAAAAVGAMDGTVSGSVIDAEGAEDGRYAKAFGGGVTTMDGPENGAAPTSADGTLAIEGPTDLRDPAALGGPGSAAARAPMSASPMPTSAGPANGSDDHSQTTIAEGAALSDGPGLTPAPLSPNQSPPSTGGILSHLEPPPPAPRPPVEDRRFAYTTDDRRMLGPLIVGALVGLLALIGVGGYLISRSGDGTEEGEGPRIETVDGPSTSFGGTGNANEATGRGSNGGRGTLEPGQTGDDSETTDSTSQVVNVVVPSLTGKTLAQARSELTALGFVPNPVDEVSGSTAVGTVIRQSPTGGGARPRGSTITIYIAATRPAETVLVPSVTGDTRAEAEAALIALGLEVSPTVTTESHPTVAADLVVRTAPASGSTVNVGSTVSLVLSSGVAAPGCSAVVGLSEAEASAQLSGDGLTVSSDRQPSATVPTGDVISCTRTETTATLVVSSGVQNGLCSEVIGTQLASARTTLTDAGLTVTETGAANSGVADGEVFGCTITGTNAAITYATVDPPPTCQEAVGEPVAQARSILQGLGFTDIVVNQTPSDSVPSGEVVACSASGGTATLTVSSGPDDPVVPDVVGRKRAAGIAVLRAVGFDVATPVTAASEKPAGEIISTSPVAGTMAPAGSTVTITVSSGPAAGTPVPALIGLSRAAANQALTAAGLTASFTTRDLPVGSPNIDKVVAVSPTAGTEVAPGSTVTVTMGVAQDDGR